ncbi:MAG: putative Casein kinase 1, partial [Streblomastix strix]
MDLDPAQVQPNQLNDNAQPVGQSPYFPMNYLQAQRPGKQKKPLDRFKLDEKHKIGSGAFGEVYQGFRVIQKGENKGKLGDPVAIKVEDTRVNPSQLLQEKRIYKVLRRNKGFPRTYYFGQEHGKRMLVMDYMGPSLEELFQRGKRQFSLRTVIMLAEQMLARVQALHQRGYIHRDVKPDNFLIGYGNKSNIIFMIDFGLAKRYTIPETGLHIPQRRKQDITGTLRYCSVHTHNNSEQSRRDDLEAIGYIIVYFLKGFLPWQGMRGATRKIRQDLIGQKKREMTSAELCSNMPDEIAMFVEYVRGLQFDENPDYARLRRYLRQAFVKEGFLYTRTMEWDQEGRINLTGDTHFDMSLLKPGALDRERAAERWTQILTIQQMIKMETQIKPKIAPKAQPSAFSVKYPTNRDPFNLMQGDLWGNKGKGSMDLQQKIKKQKLKDEKKKQQQEDNQQQDQTQEDTEKEQKEQIDGQTEENKANDDNNNINNNNNNNNNNNINNNKPKQPVIFGEGKKAQRKKERKERQIRRKILNKLRNGEQVSTVLLNKVVQQLNQSTTVMRGSVQNYSDPLLQGSQQDQQQKENDQQQQQKQSEKDGVKTEQQQPQDQKDKTFAQWETPSHNSATFNPSKTSILNFTLSQNFAGTPTFMQNMALNPHSSQNLGQNAKQQLSNTSPAVFSSQSQIPPQIMAQLL